MTPLALLGFGRLLSPPMLHARGHQRVCVDKNRDAAADRGAFYGKFNRARHNWSAFERRRFTVGVTGEDFSFSLKALS